MENILQNSVISPKISLTCISSCKFFIKIRPVPCVQYFYLRFLAKVEKIVILEIKEEKYLVSNFQSHGVDNPCIHLVLSRANFLLTKII